MLQERYGVQFDYDQRNGIYLVVLLDSMQSTKLVPHQLQMLLNNQIPQLLPVQLDSSNDYYRLQYDLTSKKRLFQMLQASPPSMDMFYEMAFRLVQTIANSSMYMLNEEQYMLHDDFIYCGKDVADLYVCYLPLPTTYSVRIEDQLRLILLRMLSTIESLSGDQDGILRIMKILHDENYVIRDLKDTIKSVWLKQAVSNDRPTIQTHNPSMKQASLSNQSGHIWARMKGMWNKRNKLKSHPMEPDHTDINRMPISGVTEILVSKKETTQKDLQISINKHGVEKAIPFVEDRFIIGRNQSGVHYTDTTEGISRVHCEFVKSKEGLEIRDLGSLNGSYLNGQFLVPYKTYPFSFGDVLTIITTEIRLTS